jgi:D-alanyl-D-alanine carboxypeptidase
MAVPLCIRLIRDSKIIENDPLYYIENYYAAGAMYSTASDLLKFSDVLYGFHILSEKSVGEPELKAYGYGLWIYDKEIGGQKIRIAERQDSIEGTTTRFLRLLDRNVTIIVLSNCWTPAMNVDQLQFSFMKAILATRT